MAALPRAHGRIDRLLGRKRLGRRGGAEHLADLLEVDDADLGLGFGGGLGLLVGVHRIFLSSSRPLRRDALKWCSGYAEPPRARRLGSHFAAMAAATPLAVVGD